MAIILQETNNIIATIVDSILSKRKTTLFTILVCLVQTYS